MHAADRDGHACAHGIRAAPETVEDGQCGHLSLAEPSALTVLDTDKANTKYHHVD